MLFLYFIISITTIVAAITIANQIQITILRRQGKYPQKGQATIRDVENLIKINRKTLAIRCYREIKNASLSEAKKAVDEIASTI